MESKLTYQLSKFSQRHCITYIRQSTPEMFAQRQFLRTSILASILSITQSKVMMYHVGSLSHALAIYEAQGCNNMLQPGVTRVSYYNSREAKTLR